MFGRVQRRLDRVESALDDALPGPVKVGFLTLYVHSTRDSRRLDRLAERPFWGRWGDAAVGALLLVQLAGLALVGGAAWQALHQQTATALNDPANTVAVPGLNAFMPLAAAPYVIAALVVATVVHEGGHALACRAEGIRVREWGIALLLGVLPLAAYVLPGEELDDAPVRSRLRVYAVGVLHNLLVAAAAGALLLTPLTAPPLDAYLAYFGWALVGGDPPTAATVTSLGPVTNLAFWLAFLNANFGLLNALPVSILDGGRVLSLSLQRLSGTVDPLASPRLRTGVVHVATLVSVALAVVAVLGPRLR